MQPRKEMPQQPHQKHNRRRPRKRSTIPLVTMHHAHALAIIDARLIPRRLNHTRRQVRIAHKTLFLVKRQPVALCLVESQPSRLDIDGRQPVLLGAQKRLGHAQVLVDVGCAAHDDGAEPPGHVVRDDGVDAGGAEEDELGWLEGSIGIVNIVVVRVMLVFEPVQCINNDMRRVLRECTTRDIVVAIDDEKGRLHAAEAVGNELYIVDAAVKDVNVFIVDNLGEDAVELGFVAAVGVDDVGRAICRSGGGGCEVLDEGFAAVACGS